MSTTIYTCFIASPGDTSKERELCDKVFTEINKSIGQAMGFRVESWKWENDAVPGFGIDGQDVINKQIGHNYDLFIGIMYKKFGSPTARSGSGTEEEFDNAYQRIIAKHDVDIMFYFNEEAVSLKGINLEELSKVNVFKEKVGALGGLYWEYNGVNDFETKLRSHVQAFLLKKKEKDGVKSGEIPSTHDKIAIEYSRNSQIQNILDGRLEEALCSYSTQPLVWVEPIVSERKNISGNTEVNFNNRINLEELISNPKKVFIKSPPQFGLTCLAHYLIKEAWASGSFWVYVNSTEAKSHSIDKHIRKQIMELGLADRVPQCIIVDSWQYDGSESVKKIQNIMKFFPDIPLIVMNTIDDLVFQAEDENENTDELGEDFDELHLLAMPRTHIRQIVSSYNKAKGIGEEDIVLTKVISDLDALNIHRTPLNCLTLLKVAEKYFDESPVNRTRMLELVLFVLFNIDGVIPTYKSKPDLKDCEYVLGKFCEGMIRKNIYEFSRESLLNELHAFCSEKLIELDIDSMFTVLINNSIIVNKGHNFCFRFSYWIFYFAAKQMHSDSAFAKYIFENDRYASFPEIIEFYTGIDRNRADALEILTLDVKETCDAVFEKVGLPGDMNPFRLAKWNPSDEHIVKMQKEIGEDVINSRLPEAVKDRYADKEYNQTKPYDQSVTKIMEEYSLNTLIQKVRAASRALRNSDYVEPNIKRKLLEEITRSWDIIGKVILALTPVLASEGHALYGGITFIVMGDGGDTYEDKMHSLICVNPKNTVKMFKADLFSNKIGPLLYDRIHKEEDELKKHHLMILLTYERPNGWKLEVENYIVSLSKNSFYLADVVEILRNEYRYAFASSGMVSEMTYLIKLGLAKHQFGDKKPRLDKILKISNKALPKREVSDHGE